MMNRMACLYRESSGSPEKEGTLLDFSSESFLDGLSGETKVFPVGIVEDKETGKLVSMKIDYVTMTEGRTKSTIRGLKKR